MCYNKQHSGMISQSTLALTQRESQASKAVTADIFAHLNCLMNSSKTLDWSFLKFLYNIELLKLH